MMKLCIRTDVCGNDLERVAQYCVGLGQDQIWAFPELAGCYGEDGSMELGRLERYHERWRRHGLRLRLITEMITDEDVSSPQGRRNKIARIQSVLTSMQAANVESLFLIVTVRAGGSDREREALWSELAGIYGEIVAHAETVGRRLANHGHQTAEHLIFSAADMERLLSLAPSEANGLAFCTGCFKVAGDDIGHWLERFGTERIFLVHMRDVRRHPDGSFEDVRFGDGEVDLKAVARQLNAMGYEGLVCPEHLPRVPYDPHEEISTAWGTGYLCALLGD